MCSPLLDEKKKPLETLIGKRARVEKTVDNFSAGGTILCEGETYLAESEKDEVIPTDTVVTIVGCREGKAVLRPLDIATDK